jgi:hypothetical protein
VLLVAVLAGYWGYSTEPTGHAGRAILIAGMIVSLAVGAAVFQYLRNDD